VFAIQPKYNIASVHIEKYALDNFTFLNIKAAIDRFSRGDFGEKKALPPFTHSDAKERFSRRIRGAYYFRRKGYLLLSTKVEKTRLTSFDNQEVRHDLFVQGFPLSPKSAVCSMILLGALRLAD
jgi:hypothetical protein